MTVEEREGAAVGALREIAGELARVMARRPEFNSPHEGWAVLREEVDELWEHVRSDTGRTVEARDEAIQIAAVAVRYAAELCDTRPERSAA